MSTAVHARDIEQTDVPFLTRSALKLGLIEAIAVLLFSLAQRFLPGPVDTIVSAVVLVAGIAAVIALPGLWSGARTIDGIASAAGIGLGAAVVYLLIDVSLLQPIGTYSNRWLQIGGGSNWWYHPVWWMVGTFVPWMGAFILANQAERGGASVGRLLGTVLVAALALGALAVTLHVPFAGWSLGTFAVAVIPALALVCVGSGVGRPRA